MIFSFENALAVVQESYRGDYSEKESEQGLSPRRLFWLRLIELTGIEPALSSFWEALYR
jgi:hypothetical protein